jgi:hypothetical protein
MKSFKLIMMILLGLPFCLQAQDLAGQWEMEVPGREEGTMVTVVLTMSDDGTYTVDFEADGQVEVKGAFERNGNQITIWDTGGVEGAACPSSAKGVYQVEVSEEMLKLNRVSDDCTNRGGPEGKMVFSRRK